MDAAATFDAYASQRLLPFFKNLLTTTIGFLLLLLMILMTILMLRYKRVGYNNGYTRSGKTSLVVVSLGAVPSFLLLVRGLFLVVPSRIPSVSCLKVPGRGALSREIGGMLLGS